MSAADTLYLIDRIYVDSVTFETINLITEGQNVITEAYSKGVFDIVNMNIY